MSVCYLEDYDLIKVITDETSIKMLDDKIQLTLISKEQYDKTHYLFKSNCYLKPYLDYYLLIGEEKVHLSLGKIARSKIFDEENYYDGPLGVIYSKYKTTFNLWSPVAKEVYVMVNDKAHQLCYNNNHWEVTINGDLKNSAYYFIARINDEFFKTLDPYALSGNGEVNYVVDLNKTYKIKDQNYVNVESLDEAIIYEAHLKDLSYPSNNSYYLEGIKKGPYLKDLGITHLQLMPVNEFFGIDKINKDELYNWGYNPLEYFNLSNWYTNHPNHPTKKINEFKKMVEAFHKLGIGINLDVVFNHVYKDALFSLGKLIPGYAFRVDERDYLTDASGCGNDLATEKLMIRRLIIDVCTFFAKFYHIDGFRFDLMGLIDIETLKLLEEKLKAINPSILLYGEGWVMKTGISQDKLANMNNQKALPNFGFFNDQFRNKIVGNHFSLAKGYLLGANIESEELVDALCPINLNHPLNYLECHDNYTFNDFLELNGIKSLEKKKDLLKLGLALMVFSLGTPFIHYGLEFGRSKKGKNNSYKDDMTINGVDFNERTNYLDVINYLKRLISIRKEHLMISKTCQSKNDAEFKVVKENDFLHYFYDDEEFIITNKYEEFKIYDEVINKPGLYIFKDKIRIL